MYFEPGFSSQAEADASSYWILFMGNKVLTHENEVVLPGVLVSEAAIHPLRKQYLGQVDGLSCFAAELSQDMPVPEGMLLNDLRKLLGKIPDDIFFLVGRAYQIMHWDRTHQFCGRCGAPAENKKDERAKLCPSCGLVNYPRISPAIIVAITRGREILLAKGSRFQGDFYSVLAGFVEPGETFEECVQREVNEEVGIKVKNIKYFGSQPWPFPDSLMIGFTAEYDSGEFDIDEREILDAGWFTAEQLPTIPGKGSIARRLIEWFIESSAE